MGFLKRMNPRVRAVVDWVVGLTLIAIGIVGGFIPILQGWIFIVAGLAVLSSHSKWARALYERFKKMGRAVRHRVKQRRENGTGEGE